MGLAKIASLFSALVVIAILVLVSLIYVNTKDDAANFADLRTSSSDHMSRSNKASSDSTAALRDDLDSLKRLSAEQHLITVENVSNRTAHIVQDSLVEIQKVLKNPYQLKHLGEIGEGELFRLRDMINHWEEERSDPPVDYQPFADACVEAAHNDEVFATFRQHPALINMLEHVKLEKTAQYLDLIARLEETMGVKINWDDAARNDQYGGPVMYTADNVSICPTTSRYVVFSMRCLNALRNLGQPVHIIEIGGGYGGQAAMTFKVAKSFGVEIESYTILDLPEPNELQRRYLSTQLSVDELSKVNCTTLQTDNLRSTLHENSFLFSAYAYSEISHEAQEQYDSQLMGLIGHGLIIWNSRLQPTPGFFHMIGKTPTTVDVMSEKPKTGAFNHLISF